MAVPKILKLHELLDGYLAQGKTITDVETSRLTAMGENYGSQMLALKIHVETGNKKEILEAVAKIPPPGEFIKRMFNVPVTFRNEVCFYKTIVPELEKFLHEKNIHGYIDYLPKLFGARLSLDPSTSEVDDDATIVLENLKVQGYEMVDRTVGFDYETTKLIIKALAKYHAVPLALKHIKPDLFQTIIRSLFQPYKVFEFDEAASNLFIDKTRKVVEDIDSCKNYGERVADRMRPGTQLIKNDPKQVREPYSTIIHTDAWVNNFMIKYQGSTPVSCKLVDFQLGEYGSPAVDVVFMIFSSVQIPVVQDHYDDLVELYHQTLLDNLSLLGCDTTPFSLDKFQEEIEQVVRVSEIFHCMVMLHPIFATKENIKELDEYKEEDLTEDTPISNNHKDKAEFLVHQFIKRKWV